MNTKKNASKAGARGGAERVGRAENLSSADVAEWLRTRIRKGRLVPGQRLIEVDLIRETGASRTRVREALQRLEAEGLVSIEEFRGASVRVFSREELSAIYRTRAALEGLAAAEFAQAAQDSREALATVQRELDAAVEAGDREAFASANNAWHGLIIQGCGNAYVMQFVERLRVPVSRLLMSSFHNRQRLEDANADHRAITAAILAGDSPEAEQRMRQHIDAGFAALLAHGLEE